jgi:hypothetical protein
MERSRKKKAYGFSRFQDVILKEPQHEIFIAEFFTQSKPLKLLIILKNPFCNPRVPKTDILTLKMLSESRL